MTKRKSLSSRLAAIEIALNDRKGPAVHKNTQSGSRGKSGRKPRNRGMAYKQFTLEESGSDIIGLTSLSSKSPSGKGIMQLELNPALFDDTRLQALSRLWNEFYPVTLTVSLLSGASKDVSGQHGIGHQMSVSAFPVGHPGVQRLSSLIPHRIGHLSESLKISIPCGSNSKWYQIYGPDAVSKHGSVVCLLVGGIGGITGDIDFFITMDWTIRFRSPRIPAQVAGADETCAVDGYYPYWTTSDGSVNNQILILKAHEIDADPIHLVSTARPQTVYELDSNATLSYQKSDGTYGKIKYAVCVWSYPYKTFTVFDIKENAQNYAKNGDRSYCLKYYGWGQTVSPANPIWRALTTKSELDFAYSTRVGKPTRGVTSPLPGPPQTNQTAPDVSENTCISSDLQVPSVTDDGGVQEAPRAGE